MSDSFSAFNSIIGLVGSVVTIVIAVFSSAGWVLRQLRKREQSAQSLRAARIRIVLARRSDPQARQVLPYAPRRDQATRGEVFGILGMYFGGERFSFGPGVLAPTLESGAFDRMVSGETDEVEVTLPDDEFDKFVQKLSSGRASIEAAGA